MDEEPIRLYTVQTRWSPWTVSVAVMREYRGGRRSVVSHHDSNEEADREVAWWVRFYGWDGPDQRCQYV